MENKKHNVMATWSGSWPCLCHGEWTLIIDDEDMTNMIPEELRDENMGTKGTYKSWHFNDDWIEEFESYSDGLNQSDWIKKNDSWLSRITYDQELKEEIFGAFQQEDWRHGSCGGCI